MVPSKATHSLTEETTCAGVGKKFGSKAILVFQGTHRINQAITEDYLSPVMFTPHRLLVWDSFKCHVGKDMKDSLKKLKVDQAVIPGGCTGFIQVSVGINVLKPAVQDHTMTGLRLESKNIKQQATINLHLWR